MLISLTLLINGRAYTTYKIDLPNIGGKPYIPEEINIILNFMTSVWAFIFMHEAKFPLDRTVETIRNDISASHVQYVTNESLPVHATEISPFIPSGALDHRSRYRVGNNIRTVNITPRRSLVNRPPEAGSFVVRNHNSKYHASNLEYPIDNPNNTDLSNIEMRRNPYWLDKPQNQMTAADMRAIPPMPHRRGYHFLARLPHATGPVLHEETEFDEAIRNFPEFSFLRVEVFNPGDRSASTDDEIPRDDNEETRVPRENGDNNNTDVSRDNNNTDVNRDNNNTDLNIDNNSNINQTNATTVIQGDTGGPVSVSEFSQAENQIPANDDPVPGNTNEPENIDVVSQSVITNQPAQSSHDPSSALP